MRIARLCTPVAILLTAGGLAAPQTTFRSGVDLVRVDLLVVKGNQPVAGLVADDFEVLDNGIRQEIHHFSFEEAPIDVLLVLDTSRSVSGPRLGHLVQAGRAFLGGLGRGDHAGLVSFSREVRLQADLTGDLASVDSAFERIEASGSTTLLDALYAATVLTVRAEARKLILLFSDGLDNSSWLSTDAVIKVMRGSDLVVYCVSVKSSGLMLRDFGPTSGRAWSAEPEPNAKLLRTLAEETGGRLFWADSSDRLRDVFVSIVAEMKARYLLTYYAQGVTRPGWHTLSIRLKNKTADVIARRGYYVHAP